MACTRDRIINFLESLNIDVNVGKNKARGNKGFFSAAGNQYRIDVAKGLSEEAQARVLVHEFAHYVHYFYDKKLKNLNFIFPDLSPELLNELISVTVEAVDKNDISPLFTAKEELTCIIKELYKRLVSKYGKFCLNKPFYMLEKTLKSSKLFYLLKHDRVKVIDGFGFKLYSIENLDSYCNDDGIKDYILLKSKQRMLRRINSKISRLNRYYNNQSELFSRAIEAYVFNPSDLRTNHDLLYKTLNCTIESGKIELLTKFVNIL